MRLGCCSVEARGCAHMVVAAKRVSDGSETIFQFSSVSVMEQDAFQSNNKCLLPTLEPHTDTDLILCDDFKSM